MSVICQAMPARSRAAYRGEPWARLGIDVDNDFKPLYVTSSGKQAQIRKLKQLLKEADELYLATDEDREGEAIAWHLLEVLSPKSSVTVKRMVFPRDHPGGDPLGNRIPP